MDAQSAIRWVTSKGDKSFRWTRYIGAPYYWLLDCMDRRIMDVNYVRSGDMVADTLTKPLPRPAFEKHTSYLMR